MIPDSSEDRLDQALRTRAATIAPPEFTAAVMHRVGGVQAASPRSSFWAKEGLRLGLVLASVGLFSVIDVGELGRLLEQALQAPPPIVLAAVTLALSVAWLSITASDLT